MILDYDICNKCPSCERELQSDWCEACQAHVWEHPEPLTIEQWAEKYPEIAACTFAEIAAWRADLEPRELPNGRFQVRV
jgi:hypothetical protein